MTLAAEQTPKIWSDCDCMDFLERMHVTVRGDDLLLVNPPNLRAAISVALDQEETYDCPIHGRIFGSTDCPRC